MADLSGDGMSCRINRTGEFHPFTRSRIIVSYREVLFRYACRQSIGVVAIGKGHGWAKGDTVRTEVIGEPDDIGIGRRCRRAGIDN